MSLSLRIDLTMGHLTTTWGDSPSFLRLFCLFFHRMGIEYTLMPHFVGDSFLFSVPMSFFFFFRVGFFPVIGRFSTPNDKGVESWKDQMNDAVIKSLFSFRKMR
ncbi:hypothetical protein RND81_14G204600 [Saponaria officinalis]|uniref:Uncharacterized protein n=1 Tax=Saponaria officinalis TaxID=3572 RepID=A0AAW1H013_SAPOF